MIATEQMQNRAGIPASHPWGFPVSAEQVLLNTHQTAGILEVPIARIREGVMTRRILPSRVDGRGNVLFQATRLHELARALRSEKAGTTFVLKFGPEGSEVSEIVIAPPSDQ